jgi:fibronectin type 3 domain-containing protein
MQVALTWAANPVALSYNVYRSITSGANFEPIAYTVTQPAYTDGPGGLVNGQSYFYVVSAVTLDGESTPSNQFPAPAPAFPVAPGGLTGVIS